MPDPKTTEQKELKTNLDDPKADTTDTADNGTNEDKKPKKKPNPALYLAGGAVGIIVLFFGIRAFLFNRIHVSTDDAYVTGDLVNISPQISGTLLRLTVEQGDHVKRGQLIATIDPSGPQASLRQAQANFEAARSQVPTARQNLSYQEQTTSASIKKALDALEAQKSRTASAQDQVSLTSATFSNQVKQARAQVQASQAQWEQAQAQTASAQASKDNFIQAVQTATDSESNFRQQIQTAQSALQSAEAKVQAASAVSERATRDAERLQILYSEDAVAAQQYDSARATARSSASQLLASKFDAEQAGSQLESARRALAQSTSQVAQARKNVIQAQSQVQAATKAADASEKLVKVADAGVGLALANGHQLDIQRSNLNSSSHEEGEAEADVSTAKSGQAQVAARQEAVRTAQAQASQAKAALTNAQITVSDTQIYSPIDGEVVNKDSNVGATISPGSTILTLTKGNHVWIIANFKETQLANVRPGQPAEIEIDAVPGKVFRARVAIVTSATGSSTALLPPDNATGNFTKVVQRVPVRLELVPALTDDDKKYATANDIANLRQGFSVVATIDTSRVENQPSPLPADDSTAGQVGQSGGAVPGNQPATSNPASPIEPSATSPSPEPLSNPNLNKPISRSGSLDRGIPSVPPSSRGSSPPNASPSPGISVPGGP